MTADAPYMGLLDFPGAGWSGGGFPNFGTTNVNAVCTATATGGKGRLGWTSGGGASLSGVANVQTAALVALSIADGEIMADIEAPNGAGVGGGLCCRMDSGTPFDSGYVVQEVTPGDPTKWALYAYMDDSPEKTARIGHPLTPPGVTGYPVRIRWAFIGTQHRVKIWNPSNSEPAWGDLFSAMHADDVLTTAAGRVGCTAWGLDASGEYAAFDNVKFAPLNEIVVGVGQTGGSNADATSYTATVTIPQGAVVWISVANSKASAPPIPTSVSCTDLSVEGVIGTSLDYDTAGSPSRRLTTYCAQATADIIAGTLTIDFGASTQLGCMIHVVTVGGADNSQTDGGAAFVHVTGDEPAVNQTTAAVSLPSFTNLNGNSGSIGSAAHTANEGTTPGATFAQAATSAHATPNNSLFSEWHPGPNQTPVNFSWSSNVRSAAIGAEVQLVDEGAIYGTFVLPKGVLHKRRNAPRLLMRGGF